MPMPEPPIDPPDDDPECPVCDAILHIATRGLASCDACGWVNEPDWGDRPGRKGLISLTRRYSPAPTGTPGANC